MDIPYYQKHADNPDQEGPPVTQTPRLEVKRLASNIGIDQEQLAHLLNGAGRIPSSTAPENRGMTGEAVRLKEGRPDEKGHKKKERSGKERNQETRQRTAEDERGEQSTPPWGKRTNELLTHGQATQHHANDEQPSYRQPMPDQYNPNPYLAFQNTFARYATEQYPNNQHTPRQYPISQYPPGQHMYQQPMYELATRSQPALVQQTTNRPPPANETEQEREVRDLAEYVAYGYDQEMRRDHPEHYMRRLPNGTWVPR